jgi:hypothetical protein
MRPACPEGAKGDRCICRWGHRWGQILFSVSVTVSTRVYAGAAGVPSQGSGFGGDFAVGRHFSVIPFFCHILEFEQR